MNIFISPREMENQEKQDFSLKISEISLSLSLYDFKVASRESFWEEKHSFSFNHF